MYNAPDYDLYTGPVDPKAIKRFRLEEATCGTANWAPTKESPFLDEVIGEASRALGTEARDWRVRVYLDGVPDAWVTVLTPDFTNQGCFPGPWGLSSPLPRSFAGRAVEKAEEFVMMKLAAGAVWEGNVYAAVAPMWVSMVADTVDAMIGDGRLERDADGYLSTP